MKKNKHHISGLDPKVYVNLALSKKSGDEYGNRPHGGRKGISNHYPPSIHAFAADRPQDFLSDVKTMVLRQKELEERSSSPGWVNQYNQEANHSGQQPLMVQHFLSSNKQEQQDGVLPASQRPPSRFSVEREGEPLSYHQGLSLHQYLTATEMPGQAEKLVDIRHGRPTRTSLLRARHRSKTIPVPDKTKLEIRDDIHYLQEQALKREDRYKSVDVPEDLQPVTDGEETVHQFLVGARYNRAYYRDAKCFNKVGLYVSRENPQRCFLKPGTNQDSLLAAKTDKALSGVPAGVAFSEVTASELNSLCQSTSSLQGNAKQLASSSLQPPAKARQAWATSSIASAPSPTPNESRESFTTNQEGVPRGWGSSRREHDHPASASTDGVLQTRRIHLKSAPLQQSTTSLSRSANSSSSCDSCVLCQEGAAVKNGVPVHFHGRNIKSAPNRRKWTHNVKRGRCSPDVGDSINGRKQTGDLMLIQQYHLRILGTQMNMKDDRSESPRNKVHYTPPQSTGRRPKTAVSKRASLGRNCNNNNKSTVQNMEEEGGVSEERDGTVSSASKISVHIRTGEDDTIGEGGEDGVDATPRSQDVTLGSEREGETNGEELPTPHTLDGISSIPPEKRLEMKTSLAEQGDTMTKDESGDNPSPTIGHGSERDGAEDQAHKANEVHAHPKDQEGEDLHQVGHGGTEGRGDEGDSAGRGSVGGEARAGGLGDEKLEKVVTGMEALQTSDAGDEGNGGGGEIDAGNSSTSITLTTKMESIEVNNNVPEEESREVDSESHELGR